MTEPKKPDLKLMPAPNPVPKKNPVDEQIPYKTIAITAAITAAVGGVIGFLIHESMNAGKRVLNSAGKPPSMNPEYQPPPLLPSPSSYFMGIQPVAQLPGGQQQALVPAASFVPPPQLPIHEEPAWLRPFAATIEQRFRMIEEHMRQAAQKNPDDDEWEDE